jgi:hypothetical protein
MEIIGKLDSILEPVVGKSAKGDWRKDSFIIETNDQFPKKVHITYFNNKVDINNFKISDEIKVSINIESREFNGKWYTDVSAWKIEATQNNNNQNNNSTTNNVQAPPPVFEDDGDELPF